MLMAVLSSADLLADPIAYYPTATVACFDPTGGVLPRRRLDTDRTVTFLERLAESGAEAVLIAASTGHGHLRTAAELEEWFTAAARATAGDMLRMALLRPEDGAEVNDHLLGLLKQLGYPLVFVRPSNQLKTTADDEEVAASMQGLIEAAARLDLAVGIYSIPDVSGMPLSAQAAARLVAGPGGDSIVAAKITEAKYETSTLEYLEHADLKRLKIVQGWDPFIERALRDGPAHDEHGRQRCGVTSGPMSLAVFQYRHIFESAALEYWAEVEHSQRAVTMLFESMQDDPRQFADLQRAKYIMGLGHPLTGEVTPEQIERVFAALERLPRQEDRARLARSLDLMGDGPYHPRLVGMYE
jgi:dihydrodipicolinate synthase/N-acetylneuraminate lyase